jgi:hypothetical protein
MLRAPIWIMSPYVSPDPRRFVERFGDDLQPVSFANVREYSQPSSPRPWKA